MLTLKEKLLKAWKTKKKKENIQEVKDVKSRLARYGRASSSKLVARWYRCQGFKIQECPWITVTGTHVYQIDLE